MANKCTTGKSCGLSCISKKLKCIKVLNGEVQPLLEERSKTPYSIEQFEKELKELNFEKPNTWNEERAYQNAAIDLYANLDEKEWDKVFRDSKVKLGDETGMAEYMLKNKDKYEPIPDELKKFEEAKGKLEALKRKGEEDIEKAYALYDKLSDKDKENWAGERIVQRWGEDRDKIERFMEDGLSEIEATAMAAWISWDDYSVLNLAIYNPQGINDYKELLVARETNRLIGQAAEKLPKVKREDMLKVKENSDRGGTPLEPGKYQRGINVAPDQVQQILKKYQAAEGKVVTEEGNFAATNEKGLDFIGSANVRFDIQARDDGTGNAVALDKYKNNFYEGEIFWAPGQKFKVVSAKAEPPGAVIKLEEEVS